MTTKKSEFEKELKVNYATKTQIDEASKLDPNQLYIVDPEYTGNKALVTDENGDLVESITTDTEISYVNGVTAPIQTQINEEVARAKAAEEALSGDVGNLENLTTDEKSTIVGAINEVDSHTDTNTTNIGTMASLTTDAKDNLVNAINEVDSHTDTNTSNIGTMSSLTTDEKNTLVGAINEVDSHTDTNTQNIGSMSNLTTDNKNTLVEAINELDSTKQDNITGAATTILDNNLTANRAVISNDSGKIAVSNVTNTELGYLSGVTSSVQTQIDDKVKKNSDITAATHTKITYDKKGLVTAGADLQQSDIPALNLAKISDVTATAAEVNVLDGITASTAELNILDGVTANKDEINVLDGITATTTELNYVSGVTSAIQTQINGKRDLVSGNSKVYTTNASGQQSSVDYTTSNMASTIVQRDTNSQINVAQTPTANTHATSKKYVDDKVAEAISEAVVYKGTVDDETELPQSGNSNGDLYWIKAYSANPPAGMVAGRSGQAIWKKTGDTGEWNYSQDSIYEPDDETINLNTDGELQVMVSAVANNAITKQNDGLHVDISGKVTKNADITAATKCKITYDAKGLVTAGADLQQSDIPSLNLTKISDVTATATEVNVLDGITASTAELNILDGITATTTELNYVDGVTSSIQTQLNNKVAKNDTITGATKCKITYDSKGLVTAGADLTANDIPSLTLAKISDVTASANEVNVLDGISATTTELNYVSGVTSSIQTQLNGKQPNITGAATTITSNDLTTSRALISNGSGKVAVSDTTSTELSYVHGVTSNIQTQLNSKAVPADIGNATITFKKDGATIAGQSFTTNASTDVEIDLGETCKVTDVKINNTSIVTNKIATIPYASTSAYGAAKIDTTKGITATDGILETVSATTLEISGKSNQYKVITPSNLDTAIIYGLSNNQAGPMTTQQKSDSRDFIGATQVIIRDW